MKQKVNELLYGALMLGRNKLVEREEYLTATGSKEPASFRAVYGTVEISDVFEDAQAGVTIIMTSPGYMEIETYCPDDFIELGKSVVTSDMFQDNKYLFPFTVKADRLHDGRNFTEIRFMTARSMVTVSVVINNKVLTSLGGVNPLRIREEMIRNYINFRLNIISREEWLDKAYSLVDVVDGNDPFSLFLMLYRAELDIETRAFSSSKNLIDYVGQEIKTRLKRTRDCLTDLDCYLLYVISRYDASESGRNYVAEKVEAAMKDEPSWQKLWIIFRLNKSYEVERGKKLNRIQQLFYYQKVHSPVMYLEALEVFLRRPELVGSATEFELQVINFGVKYGRINEALIDRLAGIVNDMSEMELSIKETAILIRILKEGYRKYSGNSTLKALCRLLVNSGTHAIDDNIYFRQAISQFLDVEGVNLYYIFTIDRSQMAPLPAGVVEYFMENSEVLFAYRSYFYANIIVNKKRNSEHYKRFLSVIIAFAEEQLKKGLIDEYMAVIYEDLLQNNLVSHLMENDIFNVICTRRIVCRNPRIDRVMVLHNELSVYQEVRLTNGVAMAQVYSSDALILFKDVTGNIFVNVDYESQEFVNRTEYIDLCIKAVPINIYMLTADILPLLRAFKDPVSVLKFMADNLGHGALRPEYESKLISDTVAYYKKHTKDEAIYDALLDFLRFQLNDESRSHLIEIMIERTMYRAAFEEIEKNGSRGIETKDLARLSAILSTLPEYDGNALLTGLCEISFRAEGYEPNIFLYLEKYYDGSVDLLVEMYRMARIHELEWSSLAERIIRKVMETGETVSSLPKIFEEYRGLEEADENIIFEYLEFRSADYIRGVGVKDTGFFSAVEDAVINGQSYRLSDCVFAAYLLYLSGGQDSGLKLETIREKLESLCDKNIMLEEYKVFGKYFELPPVLANTHIVSVRTAENNEVPHISYAVIGNGQSREVTEPMLELFEGCYVRYFTLFKDDVLTYRVEDQAENLIAYSDFCPIYDSSRYSKLDQIIHLKGQDDSRKLKDAVREYYIRDRLTDKLF